ncbi:MAG: U32 family peptidase [Stomatobaculum sp.]|nr:U32 family peptidase [Stomatobaculum sp.]
MTDEKTVRNGRKIPELLAPAGSLDSLRAAVNAGADAVYIGGRKFGARAYAENPEEDLLKEGIRFAHIYGARVHLTVNTLLKDEELKELGNYVLPYYTEGLDAIIVQDAGVMDYLHRNFPDVPLHASTQTTVTGPRSAEFWKKLGVVRVIPARELSLKELKNIKDRTGMEVETFVHGALCYSNSGQCLMSSLIGGRSGNRGRCAQPCRLPYALTDGKKNLNRKGETTLLSCRDLCSLDVLPDIIEAGIDSLKIEGRMKSPRYTAGVTEIWRKYLDLYAAEGRSGYHVDPEDRKALLSLFDRGGQTAGYYFQHNGRDMLALKEKPEFREGDEALNARLEKEYVRGTRQLPVRGKAVFVPGEPMRLSVSAELRGKVLTAEASGPEVQLSERAEASPEEVRKRLLKTGGTKFTFTSMETEVAPGVFLPVGQLNALRRDALSNLEESILSSFRRDVPVCRSETEDDPGRPAPEEFRKGAEEGDREMTPRLHVTAETEEQLFAALDEEEVHDLSFTAEALPPERWKKTAEQIRAAGKRTVFCFPQIFREEAARFFEMHRKELTGAGFDAFVIRSLEEPGFLRSLFSDAGVLLPELWYDWNVYGMNRRAERILTEDGASRLTLPIELNFQELKALGCTGKELVVSGRLPMMVTAQCLKRTGPGCDKKPGILYLKDRKAQEMPVKNSCVFCYNTILNSAPLSLCGMAEQVRGLHPASVRVLLTVESGRESRGVIRAAAASFIRRETAAEPYEVFTRGHMKRGVE